MSGGWHVVGWAGRLAGGAVVGGIIGHELCGCCFLGASAGWLCASGGWHIGAWVGRMVFSLAVWSAMCEWWLAHCVADSDWGGKGEGGDDGRNPAMTETLGIAAKSPAGIVLAGL